MKTLLTLVIIICYFFYFGILFLLLFSIPILIDLNNPIRYRDFVAFDEEEEINEVEVEEEDEVEEQEDEEDEVEEVEEPENEEVEEQEDEVEEPENEEDILRRFIENKSALFTKYPELFEYSETKRLISGKVQSGKSKVICCLAIWNALFHKRSTLITVRNLNDDETQLTDKLVEWKEELYAIAENWQFRLLTSRSDAVDLKTALKGRIPSIVVVMGNYAQFNRLQNLNIEFDFDLVVDEADCISYREDSVKFKEPFEFMKNQSKSITLITATCNDVFLEEQNLYNHKVYELDAERNYKNFEALIFKQVQFHNYGNVDAQGRLDSDISRNIREIANRPLFQIAAGLHPKIVLYRGSHHIAKQNKVGLAIRQEFPEITVIIYNGENTWIGATEVIRGRLCHLGAVRVNDDTCANVGFVQLPEKQTIREVLQFFKDEFGSFVHCDTFVIISKTLADRGISFVSKDYGWHLTHQISYFPEKQVSSSLIQSLRILGNYNDDIPLVFMTELESYQDIIRSFQCQEKFTDNIRRERESTTRETCVQTTFRRDELPAGKITKSKSYKPRIVIEESKFEYDNEETVNQLLIRIRNNLLSGQYKIGKILDFLWNYETQSFGECTWRELREYYNESFLPSNFNENQFSNNRYKLCEKSTEKVVINPQIYTRLLEIYKQVRQIE